MNIILINPPNHMFDKFDVAPPLGLLKLVDIASNMGVNCSIVDFSLDCINSRYETAEEFYERASTAVLHHAPDVVGVTSMGVNTHVAIEIARRLKSLEPRLRVLAGGVHFSSIADSLVAICPWIDTVIRGEGEWAFSWALSALMKNQECELPRVLDSTRAWPLSHPHSAYDSIDLQQYFSVNDRRLVNYEGGRGCVFRCAFCYSPGHYRETRTVSPEIVASDFAGLKSLGVRHVFDVQDNLTNSPEQAIAVGHRLAEAGVPVTWNAYATLPQLGADVVKAIGNGGCRGVYLGIDAVTDSQRVAFNKRFWRGYDHIVQRLRPMIEAGVQPTCAFMIDAYRFDRVEAEAVLVAATECAKTGAFIRLNTFTRYPNTMLGRGVARVRFSAAKVQNMFDCVPVVADNSLALHWPHLFPFHATEVEDEEEWVRRLLFIWFAQRIITKCPEEMYDMARLPGTPLFDGIWDFVREARSVSDLALNLRTTPYSVAEGQSAKSGETH